MTIALSLLWGALPAAAVYLAYRLIPKFESEIDDCEKGRAEKVMTLPALAVSLALAFAAGFFCRFCSDEFWRESGFWGSARPICSLALISAAALLDFAIFSIPDKLVLVMAGSGVLFAVSDVIRFGLDGLIDAGVRVLAALLVFLFLIVMNRITKGGLGFGDVKLFTAQTFVCGFMAVFYTQLFAFLMCAVVSALLLLTKKKTITDGIPLGPFIWAGFTASLILGIC